MLVLITLSVHGVVADGQGLWRLKGVTVKLACPDANDLLDRQDKYLAITYLAGADNLDDVFDEFIDPLILNDDLDFYFRDKVNHIFGTAIDFSVAFLAAEALYLVDCHAEYVDVLEGFLEIVKLE